MTTVAPGRTLDWTGGSLDELLNILAEPALSARVEARQHDGIGERLVGEVHVVAGGYADAFSGPDRGDAAIARLKRMTDLRFRVEPRLPHPVTGNLSPPGLEEGSLDERPLTDLMRYCEDFVLTCTVEVWHGKETARASYRRGELLKTVVNGSEDPEKIPEVLAWPAGHYRFVLPQLALPSTAAATQEMGALWEVPAGAPPAEAMPVVAAAAAAAVAAKEPHPPRATIPFLPPEEPAEVRGTRGGMPIDVFDLPQSVRSTDVGVPALTPPASALTSTLPGSSYRKPESRTAEAAPEASGPPRSTQPGFAPTGAPAAKSEAKPELKETREPKVKLSKREAREAREAKERKDAKEAREAKEAKAQKEAKEAQPAPAAKDAKDTAKDAKESRPAKDSAAAKDSSAAKEPKEKRDSKETKAAQTTKDAKDSKESKELTSPARKPTPAGTDMQRGGSALPPSKSVYDLPLAVHMGLGLLLGAVVVAGYWFLQRYGIVPPGR